MKIIVSITSIVILMLGTSSVTERKQAVQNNFERAVPSELRGSFCSVLQRGVNAQKNKDWTALYELLLPERRTKRSAEQFVSSGGDRDIALVDFKVTRIDSVTEPTASRKDGMWTVLGCALIRENGKNVAREGAATVYLENGDWYTDSVGLLAPLDSRRPPRQCRISKAVELSDLCKKAF